MDNENNTKVDENMTEITTDKRTVQPLSPFDEIGPDAESDETAHHAAINVPMKVQVVVGQAKLTVGEVMNLRRGTVIELDRKAGDVVDVTVNGQVLAKAELTVFEDGRIGATLVQIVRGNA